MTTEPINLAFTSAFAAKLLIIANATLPPELGWLTYITSIGPSGLLACGVYYLIKDGTERKREHKAERDEQQKRHADREDRLMLELADQREKHEQLLTKMLEKLADKK